MIDKLVEQFAGQMAIYPHEPLSTYTYSRTGGPADVLAFPQTIEQVVDLVQTAKALDLPLTVLGNASNLIIRDGGIRGLVLMLTAMNEVVVNPAKKQITAMAGASLIEVTRHAQVAALTGLEFACGIPGSIGGAVFMNAGAYGGEVCEVIHETTVLTAEGELQVVANAASDFAYRHSRFQEDGSIILQTRFQLEAGDSQAIKSRMDELTELRQSKQPLEYPSCGSVFKRPEGFFTGQLIQEAGLQGYRIGGVEVSKKHAGFMVNVDQGSATDYIRLIKHVQAVIQETFNVELEREVRIIGEKRA